MLTALLLFQAVVSSNSAQPPLFASFKQRVLCQAAIAKIDSPNSAAFESAHDTYEREVRERTDGPIFAFTSAVDAIRQIQIATEERLTQLRINFKKISTDPMILGGPQYIRDLVSDHSHAFELAPGDEPHSLNDWLNWIGENLSGVTVRIDLFDLNSNFTRIGSSFGNYSAKSKCIRCGPDILLPNSPGAVFAHETLHAVADNLRRQGRRFLFNGNVTPQHPAEAFFRAYAGFALDEIAAQILSLFLRTSELLQGQSPEDALAATRRSLQNLDNLLKSVLTGSPRVTAKLFTRKPEFEIIPANFDEALYDDFIKIDSSSWHHRGLNFYLPYFDRNLDFAKLQIPHLQRLAAQIRLQVRTLASSTTRSDALENKDLHQHFHSVATHLWNLVDQGFASPTAGN